jgi:hypothetical protein
MFPVVSLQLNVRLLLLLIGGPGVDSGSIHRGFRTAAPEQKTQPTSLRPELNYLLTDRDVGIQG